MSNEQLPNLYYYRPVAKRADAMIITKDICVYGGTSAGVAAAVAAARLGKSVALACFDEHVGGLSSSGLGSTDIGNKAAIGGISREFYRRLGEYYEKDEAWLFEPSAAEQIFHDMLNEAKVFPQYKQHLAKVNKQDNRIVSIEMTDGTIYRAKQFIDATYEGDLLAMAGVKYHVGRESNRQYKETLNGVHFGHPNHGFKAWIDPYRIEGDPTSGLLPLIQDDKAGEQGQGDSCVQAYNFRMCLTDVADNRIPFPKPANYDRARYELMRRHLAAGVWDAMWLTSPMPNRKTDTNNFGAVASDHIGANYRWPDGSYEEREAIFQDHVSYTAGLFYFLQNDASVPEHIHNEMAKWGLCCDEFKGTGGFPHQLYIREARRMISDYIVTEHDCRGRIHPDDPVGLAAYTMDSHNCRRIVIDGRVVNEGNVEVPPEKPYPVSYRAIVPKQSECCNLSVPVCLSSSHIAFGSIRMEPVFMVLAQSAATAASLAIDTDKSMQEVSYSTLKDELLKSGQILIWDPKADKSQKVGQH